MDMFKYILNGMYLGMLQYLSSRSTLTLLQCLQDSYKTAAEFDSRPGLKFLVQKVSKADVASNMYKQVCTLRKRVQ